MKICCCTMFSPSHQALADLTVPNLEEYCQYHGYEMRIIHIEDNKWEYKKHEAFSRYFDEGFDLIWYKDVDSIITNILIPITDFTDDRNSYYITKDFNEINNGVVILKCDNKGKWVNDFILGGKKFLQNEQNTINHYIKELAWVKICDHPSFNSYQYFLYPECTEYVGREDLGDWKEGNFLLHVPALEHEKRIEVLSQAKIIR